MQPSLGNPLAANTWWSNSWNSSNSPTEPPMHARSWTSADALYTFLTTAGNGKALPGSSTNIASTRAGDVLFWNWTPLGGSVGSTAGLHYSDVSMIVSGSGADANNEQVASHIPAVSGTAIPGMTSMSNLIGSSVGTYANALATFNANKYAATNTCPSSDAGTDSGSGLQGGCWSWKIIRIGSTGGTAGTSGPIAWREISGGTNKSEVSCEGCDGDPVNSATGEFTENETDLTLLGPGPALSLTRSYGSQASTSATNTALPNGPLGYGWTDGFNMTISADPTSASIEDVYQENGSVVQFQHQSDGSWSAPSRVLASLRSNSDGSWALTRHENQIFTFNASGALTAESDPQGDSTTVAHNASGRISTVTNQAGRTLTFTWTGNQLTAVADNLGRTVRYAYDTAGNLIHVTHPDGGVTTYGYDSAHRITSLMTPNNYQRSQQTSNSCAGLNGCATTNTYDSGNQVTSQTDPLGRTTTWSYGVDASSLSGATLITDPDGNVKRDVYTSGDLTSITTGYGTSEAATTTETYDSASNALTSVTDPDGNLSQSTYTPAGDTATAVDGNGSVTSYSYNSFGQATCVAMPEAANGCSSLSPPTATPSTASTITPPASAPPAYVTYTQYDTLGRQIWQSAGQYAPGATNASAIRTTYRLYNSQSVTLAGKAQTCTKSAPMASLPCATIDPTGVVTQLTYDSATNLTAVSVPNGNGTQMSTVTFAYDADGEQTSTITPNGNVSGATAANFTTTTTYDSDGRTTSTTKAGASGATVTARKATTQYDLDGNKITTTDPRGKATQYAYDAADELQLLTDPDGHATLTCYDGDGHPSQTVPPSGVAANKLTAASCPTSYPKGYTKRLAADATTTAYNTIGKPVSTVSPSPSSTTGGTVTTTSVYDAAGRLTETDAPGSAVAATTSNTTMYAYDPAGHQTSTTTGAGTSAAATTRQCYDPNGDRTATIAPNGSVGTTPTCSAASPWTSGSAAETSYAYDSLGEQITVAAPATTATPKGAVTTLQYDLDGRVLTTTKPSGVTTTNTYTPTGQLGGTSYSDSTHPVAFTYDANGTRTKMVDGTGTASYTIDAFNEMTGETNGASKAVAYVYDADGNTTGITYPGSAKAVTRTFNNEGRLTGVTDPMAKTTTFTYDVDGDLLSTAAPNGTTATETYGASDSATGSTLTKGTTVLAKLTDVRADDGTVASQTPSNGAAGVTQAYTYDASQRLTKAATMTYGYDADGNFTNVGSGQQQYDAANELCWSTTTTVSGPSCATTPSNATAYTYSADGQRATMTPSGSAATTYSYNAANELTSVKATATTQYSYDGDGIRSKKVVGATSTAFTWDTATPIPELLTDGTTNYIYGPTGTPIEQYTASNSSAPQYYFTDAHNSTAALTDATGAVVGSYAYNAWGTATTHTGTASTPFQFAGAYADAETGLLYLLARYYDPRTANFLTIDPLVQHTGQAYAYANDDPINLSDPLGLLSAAGWWGVAGAVGIGLVMVGLTATGIGIVADGPLGALEGADIAAVAADGAAEAGAAEAGTAEAGTEAASAAEGGAGEASSIAEADSIDSAASNETTTAEVSRLRQVAGAAKWPGRAASGAGGVLDGAACTMNHDEAACVAALFGAGALGADIGSATLISDQSTAWGVNLLGASTLALPAGMIDIHGGIEAIREAFCGQ
ncbi:RHS repeat-associated core domain-containing protein [Curtobacterium sp. VKM Ac-2922]|uniref:RHS repeat-associated core domain-containing protein n=1 Tax=Curtobacterium sp. VKM Ac-2922 TaxID=2929475 RepID=UPI001FB4AFB6|nr:RHS repeat-associated core domain-containing protein [Curtobacterium sp. VKM Ac-2922]MCJ1715117.1 DUF6531 domain-containing protein [Curtobacterium sp. VKM Ac-2922]